jgi:hypothetical protein
MFWRTLLTNTTLLLFTCTNNDHDNNDVNVCKLLFGLIQSFLSTISKPSAWDNKTNCGWFIHISVRDNRSEYTFIDWVYIVKMTYPIRWHLKLVINLWFVSFFDFHVPREPVHPHSIFFFRYNLRSILKSRWKFDLTLRNHANQYEGIAEIDCPMNNSKLITNFSRKYVLKYQHDMIWHTKNGYFPFGFEISGNKNE